MNNDKFNLNNKNNILNSKNFINEINIQDINNLQSTSSSEKVSSVSILLCIFDGKHFLLEQLESIAAQTHKNWKIYVSDDGDCSESLAIIDQFKKRFKEERVFILSGPRQGFAKNFISLACYESIQSDYYAFCDQDDIWEVDKLERSINFLSGLENSVPGLYCSRTTIVDKNNNKLGLSPLFIKPPSFANALVQNIGGGNTMLFNQRARDLLLDTKHDLPLVTHDWWMYLIVTACGGYVKYDEKPSLRYRQHESNLVGSNMTWRARFYRILLLFNGRFKLYNDLHIAALSTIYKNISINNKKIFDHYCKMRHENLFKRILMLSHSGIYRQTKLGNLGLYVGLLFKKI
jgi:glycosyltransferase involved in cell wall biosynthesis